MNRRDALKFMGLGALLPWVPKDQDKNIIVKSSDNDYKYSYTEVPFDKNIIDSSQNMPSPYEFDPFRIEPRHVYIDKNNRADIYCIDDLYSLFDGADKKRLHADAFIRFHIKTISENK